MQSDALQNGLQCNVFAGTRFLCEMKVTSNGIANCVIKTINLILSPKLPLPSSEKIILNIHVITWCTK